jgi:hypothetical protein
MSAPQMKEGPASSMLRAMFAGFGSLMSVMDRVRNKPAAEAPAPATTPAPEDAAAPKDTATPETVATETTAASATAAVETTAESEPTADVTATVAPEPPAAPAPAAVVADTAPEPQPATAPATGSALPLANYDELSVASLRARLRNLTNDDLSQLMSYERAHQDRPEVIKMFQNRLIKMTTGLPKLEE